MNQQSGKSAEEQFVGEAKQKRRNHADILANKPGCIYCAGENLADTIEHLPPIAMFAGRQRPKGLEFPACEPCNNGTGRTDLVASMMARMWPDATTDSHKAEIKRILAGVANNIPGLLQEMEIRPGAEKILRKQRNLPDNSFPLRVNGPIVTQHMETFSAKFGFALHFQLTKLPIPRTGESNRCGSRTFRPLTAKYRQI